MSRANLITAKLLEISRKEVVHLSVTLANATDPNKATLLSPELSDGMAAALLIYEQFLTKPTILNSRHEELDAIRSRMSAAWHGLLETIAAFMHGNKHRTLLKAWKTADERLAAILAKENKTRDGKKVYAALVKALEDASKAVEAGIAAKVRDSETFKQDVKDIKGAVFKDVGGRDSVIALVREISTDREMIRQKLMDRLSIPCAVDYIRKMQGEDKPYYTQIMAARKFATDWVNNKPKKKANALDSFWNAISKQAQSGFRPSRAKNKNAPPGVVPIPNGAW